MERLSETERTRLREIVESCGAIFTGCQYGHRNGPMVLFQAAPGASTLSLFVPACTRENVELAIKAHGENSRTKEYSLASAGRKTSNL